MILITGAAGQSGQATVGEFVRRRQPVRAMVRDVNRAAALRDLPGVELVEGDMLRPSTLGPALDDVDRVLLISSSDGTMLEAQCTFVDAARAAGVPHVIKFSGQESGIGFEPGNFRFTRLHRQIERYLEASSLAWTHLRPSQFMQVYLREARSITERGVLALPAGKITLAPVDVLDIAKVAHGLLTTDGHEGRGYQMTGPQALTMADIAAAISRAIAKTVAYVSVSPAEKRASMLAAGVPDEIAEALYDRAVERLAHPESQVCLTAHEMFDLPATTFGEFAQRHAKAFGRS